jgi:hypothetical protein
LRGCSSLSSIILPNSATRIGDSCFHHCLSLQNFGIPLGLKFDSQILYNCPFLISPLNTKGF